MGGLGVGGLKSPKKCENILFEQPQNKNIFYKLIEISTADSIYCFFNGNIDIDFVILIEKKNRVELKIADIAHHY